MKPAIYILTFSVLLASCCALNCCNKIRLRLDQKTELIHLRSNEYILSFRQTDIIQTYKGADSLRDKMMSILLMGDTTNYNSTKLIIDSISNQHREWPVFFSDQIKSIIENGDVKIYSTVHKSILKKVQLKTDDRLSSTVGTLWHYCDPNYKDTIITIGKAFIGTPNF